MTVTRAPTKPTHSLSGGERRRLEICRALTLKPKFLLLDEPFTGIDPLTIAELQKILATLKSRGIGILLSDHNVRDTFKIADRAYIIDEGRILIEGPPDAVAADETARASFLGEGIQVGAGFKRRPLGWRTRTGGPRTSRPGRSKTGPGAERPGQGRKGRPKGRPPRPT